MSSNRLELISTDDGSYTLRDAHLDENYHSKFGARSESDQVFFRNSGVQQRMANRLACNILEIGFGTGYNFLYTALAANSAQCKLHYTGIELNPPPADLVRQVLKRNTNSTHCFLEPIIAAFDQLESLNRQVGADKAAQNVQTELTDSITLQLINANALCWSYPAAKYDAIYLDAFSSRNNPDLWHPGFLGKLQKAVNANGTLATYCVNRSFRDALSESGWQWKKLPGPIDRSPIDRSPIEKSQTDTGDNDPCPNAGINRPRGKREVLAATPSKHFR